jgi:hypothetical protein
MGRDSLYSAREWIAGKAGGDKYRCALSCVFRLRLIIWVWYIRKHSLYRTPLLSQSYILTTSVIIIIVFLLLSFLGLVRQTLCISLPHLTKRLVEAKVKERKYKRSWGLYNATPRNCLLRVRVLGLASLRYFPSCLSPPFPFALTLSPFLPHPTNTPPTVHSNLPRRPIDPPRPSLPALAHLPARIQHLLGRAPRALHLPLSRRRPQRAHAARADLVPDHAEAAARSQGRGRQEEGVEAAQPGAWGGF